jgi:UDP:flavonoid glycosyltransferase YjiC (YdhE family)
MRALFTSSPASIGHFHPLVPLARALADAGHEVAVAAPAALAAAVAHAGFRHLPAGRDRDLDEAFPERAALPRASGRPSCSGASSPGRWPSA